ncbi:MAG: VWA domain-containing protein [Balneolaceae bacterium]
MTWADPHFFWLLALIPLLAGIHIYRHVKGRRPFLLFSAVASLRQLPGNWKARAVWLPALFYLLSMTLVIIALARPQEEFSTIERHAEGIDIVLSIDISSSMLAEDFEPNRLIAAKEIAGEFIRSRPNDRIGLNVFARQSFTVCPPTLDHYLLLNLLDQVDLGMVEDGTAIGLGIATGINRLRESEAESRVIILLTDGLNNAGEIDPVTAGELAETHGIRIYTMGIGTRGTAPYPVHDPVFGTRYQNVPVNIDEEMLTHIAEITGGRYFRATDDQELREIYQMIDQLERTEIDEIIYTDVNDLYPRFLLPAILAGLIALLADRLLFRPAII